MKVMSIIGLVLFPLFLIIMIAISGNDCEVAIGWATVSLLYAIAYSIVGQQEIAEMIRKWDTA